MTSGDIGTEKLRWILWAGWHGKCPECGKGHMFRSWLKLADRCENCGLDFSFAAPDKVKAAVTALPLPENLAKGWGATKAS